MPFFYRGFFFLSYSKIKKDPFFFYKLFKDGSISWLPLDWVEKSHFVQWLNAQQCIKEYGFSRFSNFSILWRLSKSNQTQTNSYKAVLELNDLLLTLKNITSKPSIHHEDPHMKAVNLFGKRTSFLHHVFIFKV